VRERSKGVFGAFTELTTAFTVGKGKRERKNIKSYDVLTMCQ